MTHEFGNLFYCQTKPSLNHVNSHQYYKKSTTVTRLKEKLVNS